MNRNLLISLDKTIFQIAFYFVLLIKKLRKPYKPNFQIKLDNSKKFLVIRPGGLGDGLMSIPFLKILKEEFPENRITLLCVKKNKAALEQLGFIDEIIVLDNLNSLFNNLFILLRNQFDVVFDFEPFRKISSIITYASGASIRIGFDTNIRRELYTHFVTYPNEKFFESLNMIRQLKVLNIEVSPVKAVDMSFPLPAEVDKKVNFIMKSHKIQHESDFTVAIAPGVLKPHHRWIMLGFANVIDLILKEDSKIKILLVGSPADLEDANEVIEHLNESNRIINLVGKTNFMEALGVMKFCKILITCDGGIVYMAAAMGCSTISIWGPGVMDRFKPPGPDHIGIQKDYFCIPCVNYSRLGEFPPCPYDRRCINDITPEDVFEKYVELKNRKGASLKDNKKINQLNI